MVPPPPFLFFMWCCLPSSSSPFGWGCSASSSFWSCCLPLRPLSGAASPTKAAAPDQREEEVRKQQHPKQERKKYSTTERRRRKSTPPKERSQATPTSLLTIVRLSRLCPSAFHSSTLLLSSSDSGRQNTHNSPHTHLWNCLFNLFLDFFAKHTKLCANTKPHYDKFFILNCQHTKNQKLLQTTVGMWGQRT